MLDHTTLSKIVFGLVLSVVAALATRSRHVEAMSARRFTAAALVLGVAMRAAVFLGAYVVLGMQAQSDVVLHYYPQARDVLLGQVPGRDFATSYAPGFAYLAALPVALWNSPKSIIILGLLLEVIALPVWLHVARTVSTESTARVATLLYLLNPLPLVNVALNGQNQVYCALLLACSYAMLLQRRPFRAGLSLGLSLVLVKVLGLLLAPGPFVAAGQHRWRWAVGFGLPALVVYGAFVGAGIDVFGGIRHEASDHTSGNLPFVLSILLPGGTGARTAWLIALAGTLIIVSMWSARRGASTATSVHVTSALTMVFLILSNKSYTNYLMLAFFPICMTIAASLPRWQGVLTFGAASTLAVVEPSLWHRYFYPSDLLGTWHSATVGHRLGAVAFTFVELLLLASYVACLALAWRLVRRAPTATNG